MWHLFTHKYIYIYRYWYMVLSYTIDICMYVYVVKPPYIWMAVWAFIKSGYFGRYGTFDMFIACVKHISPWRWLVENTLRTLESLPTDITTFAQSTNKNLLLKYFTYGTGTRYLLDIMSVSYNEHSNYDIVSIKYLTMFAIMQHQFVDKYK